MAFMLSSTHPKRLKVGLWTAVGLTALAGIVNLLSAVTPALPDRLAWLETFLPFELRASGRLFSAVTGFMFLSLAGNLLRRKRLAWLMMVVLLSVRILVKQT